VPQDVYSSFEVYCSRQSDNNCDPLGGYQGFAEQEPVTRKWLFYATSVNVLCCDAITYQQQLQQCPVCGEWGRSHLALILGLVLGFVGLVALVVAWMLWRRRGLARRAARWKAQQQGPQPAGRKIADAGHAPPPTNIGPAFTVHKASSSTPHHQQQQAFAQRPDHAAHMAQQAPPPVVIKVNDPHNKKQRKEEPDAASSPVVTKQHDSNGKHKQKNGRS
jgi:hypothetical protein